MNNKVILCLIFLSSFGGKSFAQQDPMFIQYMDNQIYVNPAFAGAKEYMEITGVHRQQWVGVSGAPMTTTLAFHTPLKYKSIGLGIDLMNDRIGPVNRFNASIDFAYRIHFKNEHKLSFGIKAGVDTYNSRFGEIDHTGIDPLAQELRGAVSPTIGVGAYYFAPKWFLGASVPRLTSNLSGKVGGLDEAKHIFAIAGGLFDLGSKWQIRPTTQIRFTSGTPLSVDISVAAINNRKFWIGAMYRVAESFGVFVQYKIADQFKIGYAYDYSTTKLRNASSGSHEILLSYGFSMQKKGLISPRYF